MSTEPNASRRPESDEFRIPVASLASCRLRFEGRRSSYDAGPPRPPAFSFRHDQEKGLFILTWADGRAENSAKTSATACGRGRSRDR